MTYDEHMTNNKEAAELPEGFPWDAPQRSGGPKIRLWIGVVDGAWRPVSMFVHRERGLRAQDLRRIPLGSLADRALRDWEEDLPKLVPDADALQVAAAQLTLRMSRSRGHGPDHWLKVAAIYREAYGLRSARKRGGPTTAVAQAFNVPYSTAARWVSRCRNEFGLLPKTKKGQARIEPRRRGGRSKK